MTTYVTVTRAQKNAAQWMVQRYLETGRDVPEETRRIAEATPAPNGHSSATTFRQATTRGEAAFIPAPARASTAES